MSEQAAHDHDFDDLITDFAQRKGRKVSGL